MPGAGAGCWEGWATLAPTPTSLLRLLKEMAEACLVQAPDAGTDGQPWPPPLQAFFGWSKAQEEAGRLQFNIKEREVPEAGPSSNDTGVAVEGDEGDDEELCGVEGGPPAVYALRK